MKNKKMKVKVTKIEAKSLEELLQQFKQLVCNNDCEYSTPVTEEAHPTPDVDIDYFINQIAIKKGWKPMRVAGWLDSIAETSPAAAFSIVAREIAVFLDKKYEDHIENSDKIYVISTFDGRIHEACKKYIKNYRNFAAFRTIEDAKFACNLLRESLKDMFANNAKGE